MESNSGVNLLSDVSQIASLLLLILLLPARVREGAEGWKGFFSWLAKRRFILAGLALVLLVGGLWLDQGVSLDTPTLIATVGFLLFVILGLSSQPHTQEPPVPHGTAPSRKTPSVHTGYIERRHDRWANWRAGNKIQREGGEMFVSLWVRSTDATELAGITCVVQDPDGNLHRSMPETPSREYGQQAVGRKELIYPGDFYRAPEQLAGGKYKVRWQVGSNDALLKIDEFNIPLMA